MLWFAFNLFDTEDFQTGAHRLIAQETNLFFDNEIDNHEVPKFKETLSLVSERFPVCFKI